MATFQLNIRGKVQGVFYRASARKTALELGIRGWIKNCPDGTVAARVQADMPALQAFIVWCHKGPGGAEVSQVDVTPLPDEKMEDGFIVLH